MVKYPQNIVEAAKILDNWDKKWAEKINLATIDFEDFDDCLLGQVFVNRTCFESEYGYSIGMRELFGIDIGLDYECVYQSDDIFGLAASIQEWTKEVRKRVKEKVYEVKIKGRKTKLTQKELNELYDTLDSLAGN